MISIKILASPNSVLFSDIHPFYKWEKQLRDQGLNVSIYFDHKKLRLSENDYLIINNRYFGKKWNQPSDADPASTPLIKYLQEVKKKFKK